jgi:hypothetical protein
LTVLAVLAACSSPVPPTLPPASGTTASTSPGQPTSSGLQTTGLPPTATPLPTPTPLVTITHEGDGVTVQVEVPAPLIPPGVTVAVEDHPLQDAPRDVRDAGVRQAFTCLRPPI